jgi:hypothetical protein
VHKPQPSRLYDRPSAASGVPAAVTVGLSDLAALGELVPAQPCECVPIWPVVTHDLPVTQPQAWLAPAQWVLAAVTSRTPQPAYPVGIRSEGFASAAGAVKPT